MPPLGEIEIREGGYRSASAAYANQALFQTRRCTISKNKRMSRDQKRKAKLAKRTRSLPGPLALAYHGDKYKRDEFVSTFLATETGIYESYLCTDRGLTDPLVAAALEKLIVQMRQGPLPPLEEEDEPLREDNAN